uniref:Peptide-methionine (S)-S-oxide reductase n=1 Tax=Panagrolaimus sp. PS1159 TaxID=55785 RepID=A0AC35GJ43_9BILA
MVLHLIGLGLGDIKDITVRGLETARSCSKIYLEMYTSILSYGLDRTELNKAFGKDVIEADREMVEQLADQVLNEAVNEDIAVLVVGDPFGATTHADLVLRAKQRGIQVDVVHNASIMNAVGCCGLQLYSFGETVSVVMWTEGWQPESYFDKVLSNFERGLHTLCLLDIKVKEQTVENMMKGNKKFEPPRYQTCAEAAEQFLKICERRQERNEPCPITLETPVVGLARVGWKDQHITSCTLQEMTSVDMGPPLHCLVIPGKMHPLEEEMKTATTKMPLKKAVFGIQCFWGAESSLAKVDGVIRTRCGYAGGTTPNPTYQAIADHTEVVEAQYDDQLVSYDTLLRHFWQAHDPTLHRKKQYQSAILYTDDEQKVLAEASYEKVKKEKPNIETYVKKLDKFYEAEDYHQKYWLQCQNRIHKELNLTNKELVESPLAAKINAYLAGYNNFDVLKKLQIEYKLSDSLTETIEKIARAGGDPRSCH